MQEMLLLFTHVIFEVGAGAAQQKDAGALGMAVLAGQVQSRVPRLERGEQRGHMLATPPAGRARLQGAKTHRKVTVHALRILLGGPSWGASEANR